jgi:hypothetical protein
MGQLEHPNLSPFTSTCPPTRILPPSFPPTRRSSDILLLPIISFPPLISLHLLGPPRIIHHTPRSVTQGARCSHPTRIYCFVRNRRGAPQRNASEKGRWRGGGTACDDQEPGSADREALHAYQRRGDGRGDEAGGEARQGRGGGKVSPVLQLCGISEGYQVHE